MGAMIREMPLSFFLFFTALPVFAAGIFLFAGYMARRQVAAIKATPTSNIGMATDGYAEFEGHAEAIGGQTVTAPLTLSPCIWYHAKVQKWTRSSRTEDSGQWSTLMESTSSTPFFLRDSTGVCTVYPERAEVTPTDKSQWYGATKEPTDRNPPRIDSGESSQPMMEVANSRSSHKYYEERIYADSPLLVLGEFTQGRFGEPEVLDQEGEQDASDVVEDGDDVAMEADDELTDKLERIARATTRASIARGAGRKPFIITTKLQAVHVASSEMGSQAAGAMALAFLGVAAFMVWVRFG